MFDLRECGVAELKRLCEKYHGYGSAGDYATYCYGVYESGRLVAGYSWMPPALGAAKSVCPEEPQAVLALSRMVAVPKSERVLKHISKPLRIQMKHLIDRTRYPVLVTYSDESQGHTGYVYQCSGWYKTERVRRRVYTKDGVRKYSGTSLKGLTFEGHTYLQRWEHWACDPGNVAEYFRDYGWIREPIPGRVWRSGNPAFRIIQKF